MNAKVPCWFVQDYLKQIENSQMCMSFIHVNGHMFGGGKLNLLQFLPLDVVATN